jgi:hypothetical protein
MRVLARIHLLTDEERAFNMTEQCLVMRYGDFQEHDAVPLSLRNFIGGHMQQCQYVCSLTNYRYSGTKSESNMLLYASHC